VKNVSIINDCGEMKIEKFEMKFFQTHD